MFCSNASCCLSLWASSEENPTVPITSSVMSVRLNSHPLCFFFFFFSEASDKSVLVCRRGAHLSGPSHHTAGRGAQRRRSGPRRDVPLSAPALPHAHLRAGPVHRSGKNAQPSVLPNVTLQRLHGLSARASSAEQRTSLTTGACAFGG